MKRRKFIQTSSLMTLPVLLSGMEVTAIAKSKLATLIGPGDDKVMVLVQLNGGNDGLNTFIPLDQYENLMKVRESILVPESSVLKVNDKSGFNGALQGFHNLYQEGQLAVVQAVGYPNQNRSHFRSTDIWTTASDSDQYISTGWLGRYFDLKYPGFPDAYPNADFPDPFAITLGSVVSETCQGTTSNYSFAVNGSEKLGTLTQTEEGVVDGTCNGIEVSYVKDIIRQTNAYSSRVNEAFEKGNNLEVYPADNGLAAQLKVVANLISGGLKTKIYVVSQGGYDTHANQVVSEDTVNGTHAALFTVLSSAIEAFQSDLIKLGVDNKVVGMTFSEFGRRIKANDSFGTDHGSAAPLFLFGTCVKTNVYGENPEIGATVANDEGVAMQYDFRSVYASLLIDWFKTPKADLQKVLFKEFQHIPFLKDCEVATNTEEELAAMDLKVFPNPADNFINVKFEVSEGRVSADIFNTQGFVVQSIFDRKMNSQTIETNVDISQLPSGLYFLRVAQGSAVKTMKFTKI